MNEILEDWNEPFAVCACTYVGSVSAASNNPVNRSQKGRVEQSNKNSKCRLLLGSRLWMPVWGAEQSCLILCSNGTLAQGPFPPKNGECTRKGKERTPPQCLHARFLSNSSSRRRHDTRFLSEAYSFRFLLLGNTHECLGS